jgi:hypothetical protein
MTFLQYLYFASIFIVFIIYKKIYKDCKILIDSNNNVYYYHDDIDYLDEYILQNYNIYDYDCEIGYDLENEIDIVSIYYK